MVQQLPKSRHMPLQQWPRITPGQGLPSPVGVFSQLSGAPHTMLSAVHGFRSLHDGITPAHVPSPLHWSSQLVPTPSLHDVPAGRLLHTVGVAALQTWHGFVGCPTPAP